MSSHVQANLDRRRFLRRALLVSGLPLLGGCAASRIGTHRVDESCLAQHDAVAVPPATLNGAAEVCPEIALPYALPDLSQQRVMKCVAGIRPYRQQRVRIEMESFGGQGLPPKTLIHNYGHGGAGLTLSWGSAVETLRLLRQLRPRAGEPIAVLGAGVIGLTVAHELLQAGYRVRIYTKATLSDTTSWLAGGQWAPSLVARGNPPGDPQFFNRLLNDSHQRFTLLADDGSWGVFHRPNLVADSGEGGGGLQHIPPKLLPEVTWHDELPLAGMRIPGRVYQTMLIEPPAFLTRLSEQVQMLGGQTAIRIFASINEVAELPEQVIVNCLGLAARDIVDDRLLVPMKGNLVYLQPQDLPYLLSHGSGYMFPRSDALVLGGSVQRGEDDASPDESVCMRILARHRRFFDDWMLRT